MLRHWAFCHLIDSIKPQGSRTRWATASFHFVSRPYCRTVCSSYYPELGMVEAAHCCLLWRVLRFRNFEVDRFLLLGYLKIHFHIWIPLSSVSLKSVRVQGVIWDRKQSTLSGFFWLCPALLRNLRFIFLSPLCDIRVVEHCCMGL